jgi:hypothetical protein
MHRHRQRHRGWAEQEVHVLRAAEIRLVGEAAGGERQDQDEHGNQRRVRQPAAAQGVLHTQREPPCHQRGPEAE